MLHEGVLAKSSSAAESPDRRAGGRVPYPAELVLAWMHDLDQPVRCPVVDLSDGGFRIRISAPPPEGTTGLALRLLPAGYTLERPVMVVWTASSDVEGLYDVGLRYF